jgi:histidine ammonia-lyase
MLNQGVTPMVPARGSVGASGDLAPMSHVGLVLIGEGEAHYQGKVMAGKEAMLAAGIKPLRLQVRDALALINGSNFICGIGSLLIADAEQWIKQAEITAAMSFEGLRAKTEALDERIHKIRGFAGAITSAKNLRSIIAGSSLAQQQSQNVQDAYSIRSTPQVIGTVRDALKYIRQQCETELNGAGDNPLFIAEDEVILTGANFQGTPIGLPLDLLGAAITMVSVLSERRLNRLVHPYLNEGLPMFLTKKPGMFSGFMTSQYTADSLVTEQRLLSSPASTLSIPASADQEDFVSMGLHAAHKCWQIIENAYGVLGIELMAAAQAINLRDWKIGRGTAAAHEAVRQVVAPLEEDRTLYLDHQKMVQLLRSGEVLNAVEKSIGKLTD